MYEQRFFDDLLQLMGSKVEVATISSGELLNGKVVNVMFDSFILETAKGNRIVAFKDIQFID